MTKKINFSEVVGQISEFYPQYKTEKVNNKVVVQDKNNKLIYFEEYEKDLTEQINKMYSENNKYVITACGNVEGERDRYICYYYEENYLHALYVHVTNGTMENGLFKKDGDRAERLTMDNGAKELYNRVSDIILSQNKYRLQHVTGVVRKKA